MEIFRRITEQKPGNDGLRKSRWLIVRNTLPQLETTTMKTWKDWFPEEEFGRISGKPPYTQIIRLNDIYAEIIFLALDKPEDIKKLLSFECTGIWFNEAREIDKSIVDAATGRVGRYPSIKDKPPEVAKSEWPTWSGIIMDTNPPTDDHWWYNLAEEVKPEGWQFFSQPSGLSKEAENVENLPTDYYPKMMSGKNREWIDVYVHGKYGFIQDGQPVYGNNYNDDVHSVNDIPLIPNTRIYVGIDFGLTPAAVFAQRDSFGQWQILHELVTSDMSIPEFATVFRAEVAAHFPGHSIEIWADPSGGYRSADGRSAFDMMRAAGVVCRPGPTNAFLPRKDSVLAPMNRMVSGKPGFLLSKKCTILRRGFNGGYKYKRLQVRGDARYTPEPDKNKFSHPHDALQYLLSGAGEYRSLIAGSNRLGVTKIEDSGNWKIL